MIRKLLLYPFHPAIHTKERGIIQKAKVINAIIKTTGKFRTKKRRKNGHKLTFIDVYR